MRPFAVPAAKKRKGLLEFANAAVWEGKAREREPKRRIVVEAMLVTVFDGEIDTNLKL